MTHNGAYENVTTKEQEIKKMKGFKNEQKLVSIKNCHFPERMCLNLVLRAYDNHCSFVDQIAIMLR